MLRRIASKPSRAHTARIKRTPTTRNRGRATPSHARTAERHAPRPPSQGRRVCVVLLCWRCARERVGLPERCRVHRARGHGRGDAHHQQGGHGPRRVSQALRAAAASSWRSRSRAAHARRAHAARARLARATAREILDVLRSAGHDVDDAAESLQVLAEAGQALADEPEAVECPGCGALRDEATTPGCEHADGCGRES
jgi:hypothetical protein